MTCVILQPSYIPWRGYFHQIQRADSFVFLDDVQYDRRGWRNRNRIKTPDGPRWLTIPVHSKGNREHQTPISHIPICWDHDWASDHWAWIERSYAKAPYFGFFSEPLHEAYCSRPTSLANFTIRLTELISGWLGIEAVRFERASSLGTGGSRQEHLMAILEKLGATKYLSGPSARAYIDEELFHKAGITVEFMAYDYPPYEQLYPPYDPQITVLDLLFMKGPGAPELIWGKEGAP